MATVSSKRAEHLSWACLAASVFFFAIVFFAGRYSGVLAVLAASYLAGSACLVWFVLSLQFHHRTLAEREKLDAAAAAGGQAGQAAIFQQEGLGAAIAARRLETFEKRMLPALSAVIAAWQLTAAYLVGRKVVAIDTTVFYGPAYQAARPQQPLLMAVIMTAVAFVVFLFCRYATGMSRQAAWKALRAGGSMLIAVAIVCFALAVSLAAAQFQLYLPLNFLSVAIVVLLALLGVETALNLVLDVYRPRMKDRYSRSAFDSRLLGIINEPGEILHTAAGAIDYQFGFKVSETWFYQLLARAVVPLILLAVVVQYMVGGIVVVGPNEQAVVERLGRPVRTSGGSVRIFGPGLVLKWPWPVDSVLKYPSQRVSELYIGFVPDKETLEGQEGRPRTLLWGRQHYEAEYDLLVAGYASGTSKAVPVGIIKANMPVQYRVKNLADFLYGHSEPERLFEAICYSELMRFAASAVTDIETEDGRTVNPDSLLGAGRATARWVLAERIQAAADAANLGIEVVFVGVHGIHPPEELAADYQRVVGAVQQKQALLLQSEAERNRLLASLAGSVDSADRLYDLAADYQAQARSGWSEGLEEAAERLDAAFGRAGGEIYGTLRRSRAYAFEKTVLAEATGHQFEDQLRAYTAAPLFFIRDRRLTALQEGLQNSRKYVVVADSNDTEIFIVDLKEKLTPSLYDLGSPVESGK